MADKLSAFDELAGVVEKLAVLLAAGVAPAAAWAYLAEVPSKSLAYRVSEAASALADGRAISSPAATGRGRGGSVRRRGSRSDTADDDIAWRGLAAAWQVATDAGAPLAPTLKRLAASLRDLADNERDARTALAGPVATTRMVMVLPLVGVAFGVALGFDTIGALLTTAPGVACLMTGVVMMLVARWWSARLVRGAGPTTVLPGLALDLVAIAVAGGASIPRALRSVDDARDVYALDVDDSATAVERTLALSARAGVPAAFLLQSEADGMRRTARSLGQRRAATLSVTLMLPLGLCILPAFMLLGVAPLMISVISSTLESF